MVDHHDDDLDGARRVIKYNLDQFHNVIHVFNDDDLGVHHHHGPGDNDILIHDHDGSPDHDHYLLDDNDDDHPDEFYDNYGPADHTHNDEGSGTDNERSNHKRPYATPVLEHLGTEHNIDVRPLRVNDFGTYPYVETHHNDINQPRA